MSKTEYLEQSDDEVLIVQNHVRCIEGRNSHRMFVFINNWKQSSHSAFIFTVSSNRNRTTMSLYVELNSQEALSSLVFPYVICSSYQ